MKDSQLKASNVIPEMVHPLGKHWKQPDRNKIEIDDTHALMELNTFHELLEYSTNMPTGVYIGKMWKRELVRGKWELGWFSKCDEEGFFLNNNYRHILIS